MTLDWIIRPAIVASALLFGGAWLAGQGNCRRDLCLAPEDYRVVDGDTLRETGSRDYIRLWGIDAPEMDTTAGRHAAAELTRLTHGEYLACDITGGDRYGRTVARCYIGSVDIACAMVAAGYARDWPRYSRGHYATC